jgi:repressor LexA
MSRKKESGLTPLQRDTLEEICRHLDAKGYPPTVKELSQVFGVTEPSIYDRIKQLVRKGYLGREGRKARSLTVLRRPEGIPVALAAIPILRRIGWDVDLLAEDNIEDEILVEVPAVRSGSCFAARAPDNGMTGSGIRTGDLVVVRQQHLANDGDIVLALLDDDITVRRLRSAEDKTELLADGSGYDAIEIGPTDRFRIVGIVVASKRT